MQSVETKKTVLGLRYTRAVASLATIVLTLFVYAYFTQQSATKNTATIAGHGFVLDVARTESEREIGLSKTKRLDDNQGMLFVFDKPSTTCFWMKDMHIDIDILWFDANNNLSFEKRNAQPNSYPKSFCPSLPAKYVVELNAGTIEALGLKPGDKLYLLNQ